MSSAMPSFRSTRIVLTTFGLLIFPLLSEAQVNSVPGVVVDAQIPFALTDSGSPVSLSNPAGLAIAPDGTVYVADSSNSRIVEIENQGAINESPATNPAKIGATATFLIPSEGLSDPNAVAVAPDGTLYFSDAVKKSLYRVNSPKSNSPVYTQLIYSAAQTPSALAVDPSGNLWVADAGLKEIVEFAPGATSPGKKASVSPMAPTGIAVSESSLYFTDATTNAVYGQGIDTPLLSGFAGTSFDFAADHAASRPTGLALDPAGNLFVLDAANKRLVQLNPDKPSTAFLVPFSLLNSPASMAVGPTGNLYITSHAQHELTEFVYNGNAIDFGEVAAGSDSSSVTLNYSFNAPASATRVYQKMLSGKSNKFAFDDNGCLTARIQPGYSCRQQFHVNYGKTASGLQKGFVALSNDKEELLGPIHAHGTAMAAVVAFYPGIVSYLTQSGSYPTLVEPQAVTASATDFFVADEGGVRPVGSNNYTFSGKVWDYPLGLAPTRIVGPPFVAPDALALDGFSNLLIADYNLGAVYISLAANRAAVSKLTIPGGVTLNHPIALAFDPSGNLYIGDTGPAGSAATAANPGFIVKVPVGGGNATKLSYSVSGAPVIFPQALTTDSVGNLYIADGGDGQTNFGDLVVVPVSTGVPAYIPTGSYTLNEPAGLGFDPASNLYVLDGYNGFVLSTPVTVSSTAPPTFGTLALLPETSFYIGTGSSLFVWPSGQQITVTDIALNPFAPTPTNVITLKTQTANIGFGPIPFNSSQNQTVTAVNVGNLAANFTPQYTETGDTTEITTPSSTCPGGIASQQQCNITFTFSPKKAETGATADFSFFVNSLVSNYVIATATSTKATPTVTLTLVPNPINPNTFGTITATVSGTFGTTPTGNVQILVNGTLTYLTLPLVNGTAVYTALAPNDPGTYSLTAVYSGDTNYLTATSLPLSVKIN
jgi:sugar lactone lactonase YvrE